MNTLLPGSSLSAVLSGLPSVVVAFFSVVASAAQEPAPPSGFTTVFNGGNLDGWHGMPHFDPRKLWAMTEEERNRQKAEWTPDFQKHWREGGKWNIGADKGSGGFWNNSAGAAGKDPLVLADKPFSEWNRFRILQVGERTTVYLNDKLVVDFARMENFWGRGKPLWAKGPIQLQTHGGEIRWRNIFLREIPTADANALLAKHNNKGFKPVFNGRDLDGWAGPIDNYEVKENAIVCKAGKGGTIFTKEEFGDFVVRLEFKLPPGGNNGLAIRYPGEGDTAYVGMCELQVLDDTSDRYKRLDPRQAHGSAYGMTAAHRGFLRPTGEWNFQEVTAKGSTITVELNGTVILDTDLSKASEFLDNKSHPGKDRKKGHFGFAGHNDPVAFRNVQIKRLD